MTKRQLSWALPALVASLGIVAIGALCFPFTVDDAFIVARYARTLLEIGTYAPYPGATPTDGVTGPLWVLPALADQLLGTELLVTKLVGLACATGAGYLVTSAAARRADGRFVAPCAAALIALQPTIGLWAAAGLETGLATLLFTVAALASGVDRPRPRLCGAAIALLAFTRPELGVACVVLLGWLCARSAAITPKLAIGIGVAALSAFALVAVRMAAFGDPLPLAAYAKPGDVALGARYVGAGVLVTTSGVGVVLAAIAARLGGPRERAAASAIVAHLVVVAVLGGDWMPGFRLLAPVLPLYAWLAARGGWLVYSRRKGRTAIALIIAATIVPTLDIIAEVPRARDAGALRETRGRELASLLEGHHVVALLDAGFVPYVANLETVDLAGLTDRTIAHARGGYLAKQIDPGYLERRDPDAILLHSATEPRILEGRLTALGGFPVEQRVAAMPWVRATFRVEHVFAYAPSYTYVLLVKR